MKTQNKPNTTEKETTTAAPAATTTALTIAQRLGDALIPAEPHLPGINIQNHTKKEIAEAFTANLPAENPPLYRRQGSYVTIELENTRDRNGQPIATVTVRPMDPKRFITWAENHIIFQKNPARGSNVPERTSIGKDLAEAIMSSDAFFRSIPIVDEITSVIIPTRTYNTSGEPGGPTFAAPGYNRASRLYIAQTLQYPLEHDRRLTPAALQRVWNALVSTYPFKKEESDELLHAARLHQWEQDAAAWAAQHPGQPYPQPQPPEIDTTHNRSACVTLALLLGHYMRQFYTSAPIGIFNGNQPGTGKTMLAWLTMAPVHGYINTTDYPTDAEELSKTLSMVLQERKPYLFFDDIPTLRNKTINQFVTSPSYTGRIMGTGNSFTALNNTQLIATGNGLETTPDVERRALFCDLACAEDAASRTFSHIIEKEHYATPAQRATLLTFCAALVHNWIAAGAPTDKSPTIRASFESFSRIIGSIMAVNGFGDPFRARIADAEGGDTYGRAMVRLLKHAANSIPEESPAMRFAVQDLVRIAEEKGLLITLCGSKNPAMSLGRKLTKYRGREFVDDTGRPFRVGAKGEDSASSFYTLEFIGGRRNTAH